MDVAVDELLKLSNTDLYDAYKAKPFKLEVEILLYVLDYPRIGKVFRIGSSLNWIHSVFTTHVYLNKFQNA